MEKQSKGFAKTQKSRASSPTTASVQQQQPESLGSVKSPLKREVEQDNEFICKFAKGCDKDENPEAKHVNFNNCTFIISKERKIHVVVYL